LPEALSVKVRSQLEAVELPVRVLVQGADPDVPDPLPGHRQPPPDLSG
jgi:hypothetical protein